MANNIFCAGQMSTLFSCCVHQKDSGVQGQGQPQPSPPPETKTLLAFGCSMKAPNLPLFSIWKHKKITDICVVLHK